MTDELGPGAEAAQTLGEDSDYEAVHGLTPNAQAALLMRRYIYQYKVTHDCFAGFPITAHANAITNPHAMYHSTLSLEAYRKAETISDPLPCLISLQLQMEPQPSSSPNQIGWQPAFTHPLVRITGSSMVTDRLAIHDRVDPLAFDGSPQVR